jgi:hypothetical protein
MASVSARVRGIVARWQVTARFGRGADPARTAAEAWRTLPQVGTSQNCVKIVEFLTTDLSAYVTGHVIYLCGGMALLPRDRRKRPTGPHGAERSERQ